MNRYDIVFIGHVTIDEIVAAEGSARGVPGGAPLFGAFAAAVSGKKIAVITRIAEEDGYILEPLKKAGIDVYRQSVQETTHMRVVHPSANVDERLMYQIKNAGFFVIEEMPPLEPCLIHLGALTDQEFTLGFMRELKERGFRLSVDMQGFVRQVDEVTRVIRFGDVPEKREIMGMVDFVKFDVVEANILTGTDNLAEAAAICDGWGNFETLITRSDGVLVRSTGKTTLKSFPTGAAQGEQGAVIQHSEHTLPEGLTIHRRINKFAASLASIKMETPGPSRVLLKMLSREWAWGITLCHRTRLMQQKIDRWRKLPPKVCFL